MVSRRFVNNHLLEGGLLKLRSLLRIHNLQRKEINRSSYIMYNEMHKQRNTQLKSQAMSR